MGAKLVGKYIQRENIHSTMVDCGKPRRGNHAYTPTSLRSPCLTPEGLVQVHVRSTGSSAPFSATTGPCCHPGLSPPSPLPPSLIPCPCLHPSRLHLPRHFLSCLCSWAATLSLHPELSLFFTIVNSPSAISILVSSTSDGIYLSQVELHPIPSFFSLSILFSD